MFPLIRRISVILLCGVVLLGQFPAWLHVVGCHDHEHSGSKHAFDQAVHHHAATVGDEHHDGLCHHEDEVEPAAETVHSSPTNESHDSDHCVICGFAGLPCGTVAVATCLPSSVLIVDRTQIFSCRLAPYTSEFLHSPRGPPTSVFG